MDIPELVQQRLGGEQLRTGVMLGDDDVVCITATRTLLYRSDGLLSDERVEEFPHDIERLEVSEGRRKTKFVFEYVEGTESLSVPGDLSREVLGIVLEGVLLADGVIDEDESVAGAFRFSELTLVICERRVVKHVGNTVWEDDYETFAFEDLTGLEFEEASVATEIVLRIDGRPQRIKTPNDQARIVEQTVKKAIFEFFDVTSMDELDRHFEAEHGEDEADDGPGDDDIGLEGGGGIDPLVEEAGSDSPFADPVADDGPDEDTPNGDERARADRDTGAESRRSADGAERRRREGDTERRRRGDDTERRQRGGDEGDRRSAGDTGGRRSKSDADNEDRRRNRDREASKQWPSEREGSTPDSLTEEDLEAVTEQLADLTEAVNRQNELLRNQQQAIKQLVEELRQGR
jgi:hypothetical protein